MAASRQLGQKSRLGWPPSCRWRRLFSIVYITKHPPPLIQRHNQSPHLQHSTIMYTIKYSMPPSAQARRRERPGGRGGGCKIRSRPVGARCCPSCSEMSRLRKGEERGRSFRRARLNQTLPRPRQDYESQSSILCAEGRSGRRGGGWPALGSPTSQTHWSRRRSRQNTHQGATQCPTQ